MLSRYNGAGSVSVAVTVTTRDVAEMGWLAGRACRRADSRCQVAVSMVDSGSGSELGSAPSDVSMWRHGPKVSRWHFGHQTPMYALALSLSLTLTLILILILGLNPIFTLTLTLSAPPRCVVDCPSICG